MHAEVQGCCFCPDAVGLILSEKANELKSKHSNLFLIPAFAQANIIGQATPCHVPTLVSCVCNLKTTPLGGRRLYPQSQLKSANDLFSKADRKTLALSFLKGSELLKINRCPI